MIMTYPPSIPIAEYPISLAANTLPAGPQPISNIDLHSKTS